MAAECNYFAVLYIHTFVIGMHQNARWHIKTGFVQTYEQWEDVQDEENDLQFKCLGENQMKRVIFLHFVEYCLPYG